MAATAQQLARMERLHRNAVRLAGVSFVLCLVLWGLGVWLRAEMPKDAATAIPKAVALGGVALALLMLAGGVTAIAALGCVTLSALGPGGGGLQKKHIVIGVLLIPFGVIAAAAMSRILGG